MHERDSGEGLDGWGGGVTNVSIFLTRNLA